MSLKVQQVLWELAVKSVSQGTDKEIFVPTYPSRDSGYWEGKKCVATVVVN